jgi:hypothetical protein
MDGVMINQAQRWSSTLLLVSAAKDRRDDDGLQSWAAEVLKLKPAAGFLAPNLGPTLDMGEEAG